MDKTHGGNGPISVTGIVVLSTPNVTASAIVESYSSGEVVKSGGILQYGDLRVTVRCADMAEPNVHTLIRFNNVIYRVISVKKNMQGATPYSYEIQVRV